MDTKFNLSQSELVDDGKYVLKTGLIFRAGKYEDKNFSMTPEEIVDAESAFQPVPIDVEHVENMGILEGKLGSLVAVYASENGEELYGTAKIPTWLNDLNEDENKELKVSCTWDRKNKKLQKLAIVKKPRVSDAALMAAFAHNEIKTSPETTNQTVETFFSWLKDSKTDAEFKDRTYDGTWILQDVHNMMARAGAICTKPKKDSKAEMAVSDSERAEFISKEESVAIQKMHDMSIEMGAKCHFMDEKWANYSVDDKSSSDKTKIGRKNNMGNWKSFIDFFKGLSDEDVEKLQSEFSVTEPDQEKEELKRQVAKLTEKLTEKEKAVDTGGSNFNKEEVDEEKVQLKKQVAELQKRNLNSDAHKFAENLINDNKILPASKEAVIAMFTQAHQDDQAIAANEVNFSNDKTAKTRMEVLAEFFGSLESTTLTKEVLAAKSPNVLSFSKGDDSTDFAKVTADAKAKAKEYAEKRNKLGAKAN